MPFRENLTRMLHRIPSLRKSIPRDTEEADTTSEASTVSHEEDTYQNEDGTFARLNDMDTCDTLIKIEPSGPLILAHRLVLESSPFFVYQKSFNEWGDGLITVYSAQYLEIQICIAYMYDVTNVKSLPRAYFDKILYQIFTSKQSRYGHFVVTVMIAADLLQLDDIVKECCERFPLSYKSKLYQEQIKTAMNYKDLPINLLEKLLEAATVGMLTGVDKLEMILDWSRGFNEQTEMIEIKPLRDLMKKHVTEADRRNAEKGDLERLANENEHFDLVVPYSFTKGFGR